MTLYGNEKARSAIDRMIATSHIPHALLFHGPKSVGKSLFAKEMATKATENYNIRLFEPEGKAHLHSIESMRSLIAQAKKPPKWLLIDDAHAMLPPAANALLKTLEEPETGTHIILITHDPQALLPTIRSRLTFIPFTEPTTDDLVAYIKEAQGEEDARHKALLARGSFARCTQASDTVIEAAVKRIQGEALERTDLDKDDLLSAIFYWYRDLHLLKSGGNRDLLFYKDREDELNEAVSHPIPSLERVQKGIMRVREATSVHIHIEKALDAFFLSLC